MATIEELERRLRNVELQAEIDNTARVALQQLTVEQFAQLRQRVFPEESEQGVAQSLAGVPEYLRHRGPVTIVGTPSPIVAAVNAAGNSDDGGASLIRELVSGGEQAKPTRSAPQKSPTGPGGLATSGLYGRKR